MGVGHRVREEGRTPAMNAQRSTLNAELTAPKICAERIADDFVIPFSCVIIVAIIAAAVGTNKPQTTNPQPETAIVSTIASHYDSPEWACASNDFPVGTILEVTHGERTILVRVAGAGPFETVRINGKLMPNTKIGVDLTTSAFEALCWPLEGKTDPGTLNVIVEENRGQN